MKTAVSAVEEMYIAVRKTVCPHIILPALILQEICCLSHYLQNDLRIKTTVNNRYSTMKDEIVCVGIIMTSVTI